MRNQSQGSYEYANMVLIDELLEFFSSKGYAEKIRPVLNNFIKRLGYVFLEELSRAEHDFFLTTALFDYPIRDNKTVIQLFKQEKSTLSIEEEEILEELLNLSLGIYQVVDIDDNYAYLLYDFYTKKRLVLSLETLDKDYDDIIQVGNIMIARLAKIGEECQPVGPFNILPGDARELIIEEVNNRISNYRESLEGEFSEEELLKKFFKSNGLEIFYLLNDIENSIEEDLLNFPEEEYYPNKLYEATYKVQSKNLVINKLSSHPNIEYDSSEGGLDFLVWISEEPIDGEGYDYRIYGRFIIDDKKMLFHSDILEKFEEGKEIIKNMLSFSVIYDKERILNIDKDNDIPFEMLENILESLPIDFDDSLEGDNIFELLSSFKGRQQLNLFLELLQIHVEGLGEDSQELEAILRLQNLIDLYKQEEDFEAQDGVERLLVETMDDFYDINEVNEALLLWRDYKKSVEMIRGRDKSWAGAVEYIISDLRGYDFTQEEVAQKYDVSSVTISKKYREIADTLRLFEL
ncbi:hypothetical protein BX659_1357 [Orenia metallireducens]|uniref:HTH psq-type domain-containing protein n=1 Tax=Orenia metallireducens TaxID=1413210 RepID=A0A285IBH0_9FIRM|nr:hypothetical protein [Orenia metallireducens]PRX20609.1 hypothetical protein BX659_1357 [Orenia metallireducens]SNY45137.1 hypothetical protein SAMN06265827_1378 [Orenia metallireducens]